MNIPNGKIAILLASYNGEKFISQQLDSLLGQTNQDFVIVIHDDGSTDSTLDIINQYIQNENQLVNEDKIDFARVQLLEGPSTGSAKANFLYMLSQVEADYYMFCDQDDVWLPEKIEKSFDAYMRFDSVEDSEENGKNFNCVFSDMYVTDADLNILKESFIISINRDITHVLPGQIIVDNPAAGCTMFFGRDLRDIIVEGLPSIDLDKIEMHDGFILAVSACLGKVCGINEPLSYYRQHSHNEMGAVSESKIAKVSRNITDILTGKSKKNKEEFIQKAKDMAGQVYQVVNMPNWLLDFSILDSASMSYDERIKFYRDHNIERATKKQTDWMYKWI